MTDTFFALYRCLCVRDRSFLMGKGEGPGGIRLDAPIVYNDPPLHKTLLGWAPLYPKLILKKERRERKRERTKKKNEKWLTEFVIFS